MKLSALQRFILRECYTSGKSHVLRQVFTNFYHRSTVKNVAADSITVSLERLIDRGLLIGYGHRTPKKWYIEEVKLTPLGRRIAKQTLGQQQHLPLK